MSVDHIGVKCEDPEEAHRISMDSMYGANAKFVDDVSGQPLDPKLVANARAEEIKGARKHNVYTKVPISDCWKHTGAPP